MIALRIENFLQKLDRKVEVFITGKQQNVKSFTFFGKKMELDKKRTFELYAAFFAVVSLFIAALQSSSLLLLTADIIAAFFSFVVLFV